MIVFSQKDVLTASETDFRQMSRQEHSGITGLGLCHPGKRVDFSIM
jgi:hypothetical protein